MARTRAVGKPGIYSAFSASGGRLVFERENASTGIEYGADDAGFNNTWYGETSGAYMQWAASGDELLLINSELRIASASFTSAVITTASINSGHITSCSVTTGNMTTVSITNAQISTASVAALICASASFSGAITFASTGAGINMGDNDIVLTTATGTMLGTGSTQKLGFWGVTPMAQPTPNDYNSFATTSDVVVALQACGIFGVSA